MIHSFHLATVPVGVSLRALASPPRPGMECLIQMRLGAPVVSPHRAQVTRLAVFAEWPHEEALDRFLEANALGQRLAEGWHVRLDFCRRWGSVAEFAHLPEIADRTDPDEPIVAVTLARARLGELPRFIHWGRPVERLVRDHPGTTLALAAMRPPGTFSTFSIWRSTREMTDMVWGRSKIPLPARHSDAMVERERRDFHHEFTTLRFRPRSEHGAWRGRGDYLPTS